MTLMKVEGVSNDVFIPEEISREDQNFLLERTENIVGIVSRAKVEIGLELLKVEHRFREAAQFQGPGGWYKKWYNSIGISQSRRAEFVNAATLVSRTSASAQIIEGLPGIYIRACGLPSLNNGGYEGITVAGLSKEGAQIVVDDGRSSIKTDADVSTVKASSANQILAAESLVKQLEDKAISAIKAEDGGPKKKDDPQLYNLLNAKRRAAENQYELAQKRLASLEEEKKSLEAKYEDWRSPESIKQEFDEAIAKAREEERAKKAEKKDNSSELTAAKDLLVKAQREKRELEETVKQLKNQSAPEPDMVAAKAIAKAELEGEVALKVQEIELRAAQLIKEANEKTRKAEEAKKAAQRKVQEVKEDLELANKNTPVTPEWVLASITQNISSFKEACVKLENIKRTDGKSNEFTDLDEYAVEAFQQWFNSFTPDVKALVVDQLQSGAAIQNNVITETSTQIIDV